MIVNMRIMDNVVGHKLFVLLGGYTSDFVTTEGDSGVYLSVNMSIATGTGHQVQAAVSILADVRTFGNLGVDAAGITKVAGIGDPDAGEVSIKYFDHRIGDTFCLLLQSVWLQ